MIPSSEASSKKSRLLRILAPIVLAFGLLLAAELGFVGSVEATLQYDLAPLAKAKSVYIVVLDESGRRLVKNYYKLEGSETSIKHRIEALPGEYKVMALLATAQGEMQAEGWVKLSQDGTYEVRLEPLGKP